MASRASLVLARLTPADAYRGVVRYGGASREVVQGVLSEKVFKECSHGGPPLPGRPQDEEATVRTWREAADVREIEVHGDEEPFLASGCLPHRGIRLAGQPLLHHGEGMVSEPVEDAREANRDVLIQFDVHGLGWLRKGIRSSSRASSAA